MVAGLNQYSYSGERSEVAVNSEGRNKEKGRVVMCKGGKMFILELYS